MPSRANSDDDDRRLHSESLPGELARQLGVVRAFIRARRERLVQCQACGERVESRRLSCSGACPNCAAREREKHEVLAQLPVRAGFTPSRFVATPDDLARLDRESLVVVECEGEVFLIRGGASPKGRFDP